MAPETNDYQRKTGSNKTEKHDTETIRLDREQRAGKTQCRPKELKSIL